MGSVAIIFSIFFPKNRFLIDIIFLKNIYLTITYSFYYLCFRMSVVFKSHLLKVIVETFIILDEFQVIEEN